jgi:antitoxin HicB
MLNYPVHLEPAEEGGFVVTFPDVPEAITQGEDLEEALMHAQDALETALSFYISGKKDIPTPSPADGSTVVTPSALGCAKIGIYQAMRAQGVSKAQLARKLNWHLPQVDRLLDLCHTSRLDQVEAALAVLGYTLTLTLKKAA